MLHFISEEAITFPLARDIAGSVMSFYRDRDPGLVIDTIARSGRTEDERQELTDRAVRSVAYSFPAEARVLVSTGRATEVSPEILDEIVYRSARKGEYLEALEWGKDHAEIIPADFLVYSVAQGWSELDPDASAAWIGSLEPGLERDAAIYGLAETLIKTDREAYEHWIGEVSDPERLTSYRKRNR